MASADTALYQAKRTGRNRVEAAVEQPLSLENARRNQIRSGSSQPDKAEVDRAPIEVHA